MTIKENESAGIEPAVDGGYLEITKAPPRARRRSLRRTGYPARRAMLGLVAAIALAASLIGIAPVAASAAPQTCSIQPYGLIGERWNQLGGVNSWLGCPTTGERDVYSGVVWVGRRQYFQRGTVAWSPRQGNSMVVAAWGHDGWVYFNWGPTSPYHYDRFLFRINSAADQGSQYAISGGTSGQIREQRMTTGVYSFIVEGCDTGTFGSSDCRQGWTIDVSTYY
jgi:LGFP repeat